MQRIEPMTFRERSAERHRSIDSGGQLGNVSEKTAIRQFDEWDSVRCGLTIIRRLGWRSSRLIVLEYPGDLAEESLLPLPRVLVPVLRVLTILRIRGIRRIRRRQRLCAPSTEDSREQSRDSA